MSTQLVNNFLEAKDAILQPCTSNPDGQMTSEERLAQIMAQAELGCLLESAASMVDANSRITSLLKHKFDQALSAEYDCPLLQQYHGRFVKYVTPLLQRTNICELSGL